MAEEKLADMSVWLRTVVPESLSPGTVIAIPCPPRAPFVPGGKPTKKARPRRLRRAWVKQYNAALKVYRKELVRLAGSHKRWVWPNFTLGRARVLAAESELPLPRSLRGCRRG